MCVPAMGTVIRGVLGSTGWEINRRKVLQWVNQRSPAHVLGRVLANLLRAVKQAHKAL
jgi:hypothetical protein